MLCEKCKINEATGYYEGSKAGVKTTMHLCTKCLLDKQKELFGGMDMFSGFVDAPIKKRRCSKCGTDISNVMKTLFVGCTQCYEEFSDQLPPIIKNIQGAVMHTGSAPEGIAVKPEIDKLEALLQKAVDEERFEDAAAISRRLKALKEAK